MAKRKAARAAGKKKAAPRRSTKKAARSGRKTRATARKAGGTRSRARKQTAKTKARKAPARKIAARKATARKAASSRVTARKAPARKAPARKTPARKAARRPATRPGVTGAVRAATSARALPARKAPDLNRARRTVRDDEDIVQSTPPSSLDLDRTASAVRSGRRNMLDRYQEHTETSPALTGGDVDADWESAYSVGDEAPGGDNPTPDQDIVDDIGRAVGIEYQDNEELKGADKLSKRDKNRWELDPASSEDWDER